MNLPVHPPAGQRVGYARISSASQNLDGQTDALTAAGCEKIFADTACLGETGRTAGAHVVPGVSAGRGRAGGVAARPAGPVAFGIWWRLSTRWPGAGWRSRRC